MPLVMASATMKRGDSCGDADDGDDGDEADDAGAAALAAAGAEVAGGDEEFEAHVCFHPTRWVWLTGLRG